jgi:hypothetical protein
METKTQNSKQSFLQKINFSAFFSNSIFIVGLLFLDWSTVLIIFGYWIDEVIGFIFLIVKYIILKVSRKKEKISAAGIIFAYGFFMFGHLVFILIFLGIFSARDPHAQLLFENLFYFILGRFYALEPEFLQSLLLIVPVALFAACFSLFKDFLAKKKYMGLDLAVFEKKAFTPIIMPHFIIVLGGFLIVMLKGHAKFALILIAAKLITEFLIYKRNQEVKNT